MSNVTRLIGAACVLVVALLGVRLGLSVGWAVVAAVLVSAAIWSAAAWAVSKGDSENLKTQTFEMALVSLVGAGILLFVALGRLLHDQFGTSVAVSVWTSIGAAVAVLIAGMVVYYKVDNRPKKPRPQRTPPAPTVAQISGPPPAADFAPDFRVQVEEDDDEEHFRGIVTVALNEHVPVVFVPDVSSVGPPWRPDVIPAQRDPRTTPTQARMLTLVASEYVITPNERLAGTTETFDHPEDLDYGAGKSTLFYVTTAEFTRFVTELHGIRALAPASTQPPRASELGGYQVIELLRRRVARVCARHGTYAKVLGASRWPR